MWGRYETPAPRWSPYDIEAAAEAALRAQVVEAARLLGFSMPASCITAVRMKHGDAIELQLGPDREDQCYLEYPMEERKMPDDPVVLRPMKIGQLFDHLIRQRWRDERRSALARCNNARERMMHHDAGPLGRWATAYAAVAPAKGVSLVQKNSAFNTDIDVSGKVDTDIGTMKIEMGDGIYEMLTLPVRLPITIATSAVGRTLGELVEMPSCGHDDLDDEISRLKIRSVDEIVTGTQQDTRISFGYCIKAPLILGAEDAIWRRLRRVRAVYRTKLPDCLTVDYDETRRHYREDCAKAGVETPDMIIIEGPGKGGNS